MGWLRSRKADPIAERSRAISAEIAALEEQIRELDTRLERGRNDPEPAVDTRPGASPIPTQPLFEPVDRMEVADEQASRSSGAHYNELGVRKYDLAAAWRRMQNHFRGPAASNPRLINYLAAGSIQGLRPLRYESRVARNRVIALSLLLLLVLWGLIEVLRRN